MELLVAGVEAIQVSEAAFGVAFNEPLIHQAVVAFMAGERQGTRAQKNRSAVRGGGRKPWRQKGSGRARAGTIRSPLWRGGGKAFAAKPQCHRQKLNKKMYRGALRSILSELIRQERLVVVDQLTLAEPKTKAMIAQLDHLDLSKLSVRGGFNALIIADNPERNVCLAARNIPHVNVCSVQNVDPVSLIAHEHVIMTVAAIRQFEEILT